MDMEINVIILQHFAHCDFMRFTPYIHPSHEPGKRKKEKERSCVM